ncbi:beta-ketoacyl synthase [Burkholderia ambifaria]|uniref:beta-ketoacyl synthase n=1 Tax=Burkholderia ambifaria TaxID=152480 RepID=UPI001C93290F|nr:beta-ketoacyl synthase [Burkholderia ambifaria]MBY4767615.1 beta-ketoacyl synthase [Burkholderia ambifaria]
MNSTPVIVAASCIFPSGPRIELADTAVRAQLAQLQRHPDYVDGAGEPVRGSFFPGERPFDSARWGLLAREALDQVMVDLVRRGHEALHGRVRWLWIVLPESALRPGLPSDLVERVKASVQDVAGTWTEILIRKGGHAAGVAAIEEAVERLEADPSALAVVLGVESGLGHDALMWLDARSLLHGAHRAYRGRLRAEPYGRVPGEGAAAVALSGRLAPGGKSWARLLGVGHAHEPHTHDSGKVCIGAGLSQAVRVALDQGQESSADQVGWISIDLNGEPYRADQFGFAALRLADALAPGWQRVIPALASGDLASASAVAHVALAAYGMSRRPRQANHLVLSSSDDPLRGAVIIGPTVPSPAWQESRPWRSPSTLTA